MKSTLTEMIILLVSFLSFPSLPFPFNLIYHFTTAPLSLSTSASTSIRLYFTSFFLLFFYSFILLFFYSFILLFFYSFLNLLCDIFVRVLCDSLSLRLPNGNLEAGVHIAGAQISSLILSF